VKLESVEVVIDGVVVVIALHNVQLNQLLDAHLHQPPVRQSVNI